MKKQDNGRDWQSAWLRELDERSVPMADYVKNEPMPRVQKKSLGGSFFDKLTEIMRNKRVLAGAGAFAVLVVMLTVILLLRPDPVITPGRSDYKNTVVALEINPSVLMSTDSDGRVRSAVALNEDADSVLSLADFDSRVIGQPLPEALAAYTDLCASLGFIAYNGDVMRLSAIDSDVSDIEDALTSYFKEKGILAVVDARQCAEGEFGRSFGIEGQGGIYDAVCGMDSFYSDRCDADKEFDELLADYRAQVLGEIELYIKEEIMSSQSALGGALTEIINGLFDELAGNAVELIKMIELMTGEDIDAVSAALEELAAEPTNAEEYFAKMKEYRRYRASDRREQNRWSYEMQRDRISDSSYENYIEAIISEYGSIAEYYKRYNEGGVAVPLAQ